MDSVSPASFSAADTSFIKGLQDTIDRDIASGRESAMFPLSALLLEEIRNRLIAVNQKQEELEQERMSLSQSAEVTVEEHIQLLRQYNKTKDVGQQLIGLIAESRGVALGTVYQDAEYGVSADD
ncbi:hypothetical protein N0V93_007027 [Gnomoniopsis smithogilvyi]|uniref:DNA repair protein SWI5 homolog n=1 Tax=Gnomoniopsis smithogilvyi TaxID=1191159 RepID=A0A9W9CW95_9PEZI|nr:hypothetical protein N0V93_007027 [Gnomoniopsis smithogilvyi]